MNKAKALSAAMTAVMLMTLFTSCSSGKKGSNTVKKDDPWYETTRVKINRDIREHEEEQLSKICTSNDNIFYMYSLTADSGSTYRTILDVYDYDGNLTDRKEIICADNHYIVNVYYLSADADGKTVTAAVWYHVPYGRNDDVFLDIDVESGKVVNEREIFNDKTKAEAKGSLDTIYPLGDYSVVSFNVFDSNSLGYNLQLFKHNEYVATLDLSSVQLRVLLGGFNIDESKGSIFVYGYEKTDILSLEFDLNSGKLKSRNPVDTTDNNSINFWEYQITNTGDMCKIDSLGNIVKVNADTMTTETAIDTNWYTPYFCPPVSQDKTFSSTVLSCSENGAVILDYELVTYACFEYEKVEYFRILKKAEKNPHEGKKVIELALPPNSGITEYLSGAIFEFNKSDNEYLIRIWDKYKNGFVSSELTARGIGINRNNESEVFQMIQDLKADDAPDLVLDIQKNYAMRDDVFMDLTDFLDPEVLDKQYKNIIEAGRIGGKLYFLPVTLEIEGLVTKSDMVKDGASGITFEEFDKLIKDQMNGFSPYDYTDSKAYNKRAFILSCIDTKRAIEGDKIEFGTEQFRTAAEYAKANIKYNNVEETPVEYIGSWDRYRGKCYYTKIADYLDYVHSCYNAKDEYSIIGTPSVDASGPRFSALETISVSAATDVKEGCRKFINYLFSGTAFASAECNFMQIVTNKEIMDKNIQCLSDHNNDIYAAYEANVKSGVFRPATGYDKVFGDKYSTDGMIRIFRESLASISIYYYEDYTIVQFLDEELAPYYAGDRSLDDAINYINDRVTKYVREM